MIGASARAPPGDGDAGMPPAHRGAGSRLVLPRGSDPICTPFGDLSEDRNFRTLASEMVFGLKTAFWGMKVTRAPSSTNPRRPDGAQLRGHLLRDCTSASLAASATSRAGARRRPHNLFLRQGDPGGFPRRAVRLHHATTAATPARTTSTRRRAVRISFAPRKAGRCARTRSGPGARSCAPPVDGPELRGAW